MNQEIDLMGDLKKLVIKSGCDVGKDEPVCVVHLADHANCVGCPSELGCCKWVSLVANQINSMFYQPKNYDDFINMHHRIVSNMKAILDANSADEVKAVKV